jgi:hypothetical protein
MNPPRQGIVIDWLRFLSGLCRRHKRKRVPAIVAEILVARHLKTTDDLFDSRSSPRTESLVAAAVQWAERIMKKIDNVFLGRGTKVG